MNRFSIKDIENLSGIKAQTWRIWEQRYGIGMPQRKESNHRFYDNENLKQILRISYLYHSGLKISKIALLRPEQIKERSLARSSDQTEFEYYIKEMVEAAIDLDESRFDHLLTEVLANAEVEDVVLNVIYPFQDKLGVLWLTDHLIPAQEHFTSNIIRQKLAVAVDRLPLVKKTTGKEIVLFTPEQEYHEIPLQTLYYLLRKNGHKVIYFGSNVSISSLQSYASEKNCTHVLFHLVTNLTNTSINEYLQELSALFKDQQIYMSGRLTQSVTDVLPNVHLLFTKNDILKFVK